MRQALVLAVVVAAAMAVLFVGLLDQPLHSRRGVLNHGRRTSRARVGHRTHAGESAGVPCRRLLGTLIGVLPGLGPVTTIALLLPFTFSLSPTGAIIMLAGIYYGAQYGGSITAILVNLPGEASSTVTCLDGHAWRARAAPVWRWPLRRSRLSWWHDRHTAPRDGRHTAGICRRAGRSRRLHRSDGLWPRRCHRHRSGFGGQGDRHDMAGFALGMVGTDSASGQVRFTMGIPQLVDGIGFMPLAIGLFGLAEMIANSRRRAISR